MLISPKKTFRNSGRRSKEVFRKSNPVGYVPGSLCGSPLEPPLRLAGVMRKLKLRNGRLLRPPRVSREIKGPGDWML